MRFVSSGSMSAQTAGMKKLAETSSLRNTSRIRGTPTRRPNSPRLGGPQPRRRHPVRRPRGRSRRRTPPRNARLAAKPRASAPDQRAHGQPACANRRWCLGALASAWLSGLVLRPGGSALRERNLFATEADRSCANNSNAGCVVNTKVGALAHGGWQHTLQQLTLFERQAQQVPLVTGLGVPNRHLEHLDRDAAAGQVGQGDGEALQCLLPIRQRARETAFDIRLQ